MLHCQVVLMECSLNKVYKSFNNLSTFKYLYPGVSDADLTSPG